MEQIEQIKKVDLALLERWLTGWCLARGLPLPADGGGGLHVTVGWPDQVRRHVFVDAGAALQACAAQVDIPYVHVKAAVDNATLLAALPAKCGPTCKPGCDLSWEPESQRYLMRRPQAVSESPALPAGYSAQAGTEHGARLIQISDAAGQVAAIGRVVLHQGCAVFDRIETMEQHRRLGLGRALMGMLDELARNAGVSERLLVATEAGRALYTSLGWELLTPYSTAVSTPSISGAP